MKLTPWTQSERDEFIVWHESGISQYPNKNIVVNGKIYNIQQELRRDRDKFLASVPVKRT